MPSQLKQRYEEKTEALMQPFGLTNKLQAPRPLKVTINAGLGRGLKDAKFTDAVVTTLTNISGQKPILTKSKKSISNFKIREGMAVGATVTLRGNRMWTFLDKLVFVTFARIRDFRGVPTSAVDKQGNFQIGLRENTAFPEVRPDEVELLHGLQISITTNAGTHEKGLALFKALGFPFKE